VDFSSYNFGLGKSFYKSFYPGENFSDLFGFLTNIGHSDSGPLPEAKMINFDYGDIVLISDSVDDAF